MKKILVIGAGGTIAGAASNQKTAVYKSGKIAVDVLCSDISDQIPSVKIDTYQIFNVDSREITVNDWIKLANFINEESKSSKYDGFVITHGSDTLEETSYFLNLTLKTDKPVVMTASMRPPTAMSADGTFNLYQAIILAKNDKSRGKGVLIAYNDTIFSAQNIQKNNCYKIDAFIGKDSGPIGFIRDDNVFFLKEIMKKHTINSEFFITSDKLPKVEITYFYPDADLIILENNRKICDGLIIAGVGNGGCSEIWNKKLNEYAKSNFPIVKSTRVANGIVMSEKNDENSIIYANSLSPQKARILLMLGLVKSKDPNVLQNYFYNY